MKCKFWRSSYDSARSSSRYYRLLAVESKGRGEEKMVRFYTTLARNAANVAEAYLSLPPEYRGGLVGGYELPDGTPAAQWNEGARFVWHWQGENVQCCAGGCTRKVAA